MNNILNEEKTRIEKDNENKRYEQKIKKLEEEINDYKEKEEEKTYANIPYLETAEEAAENIANIYEQKNNKARTFALSYNVEEEAGFNKYGINIDRLDKDGYNKNGLDGNGLDRNGYNINGLDRNGLDRNGYNIMVLKELEKNIQKEKLITKK